MAGATIMSPLAAPYMIYRPDPNDPASPPVFYPPKDSDELFDALRHKYPHVRTHAERMRDAIIEFLLEEQHAVDQIIAATSAAHTPMTTAAFTSPIEHNWQSMSSEASTLSSPDTMGLATPLFGNSPMPPPAQLHRHASTATAMSQDAQSPPAIENMTSVFSLSTSAQPKLRVRRKMTEAEKIDYRNRRIVKACENCSKRKRKCTHNQPEMESLATKDRVNKTRPNISPPIARISKNNEQHPVARNALHNDNYNTTDPLIFDEFTPPFGEDLAFFNDDFMPEITFDDPMLFDMPSQLDMGSKILATNHGYRFLDQQMSPQATGIAQFQNAPIAVIGDTPYSPPLGERGQSYGEQAIPVKHGTQPSPSGLCPYPSVAEDGIFNEANPPCTALDHTNVPADATHTKHVHSVDAQGSFTSSSSTDCDRAGIGIQRPSAALTKAVLRLVGTTKAVRTFRNLASLRNPSSPAVTLDRVVGLVASSSCAQIHSNTKTDGFLLDVRWQRRSVRSGGLLVETEAFDRALTEPRLQEARQVSQSRVGTAGGFVTSPTISGTGRLASTSSLSLRPSSGVDLATPEGQRSDRYHNEISSGNSRNAGSSLLAGGRVLVKPSGVNGTLPQNSTTGRPSYAVSSNGIPLPLLQATSSTPERQARVETPTRARLEVCGETSSSSDARPDLAYKDAASPGAAISPVHTCSRCPISSRCSGDTSHCLGCGTKISTSGRSERSSWQEVGVCLAVMCGLVLASSLTTANTSLSWFLLACLAVHDPSKRLSAQGWKDIVSCTIKNSSWLSGEVSREAWTWDVHPKQSAKALPSDYISWHDKGIELGWSGIRWIFSL